MPDEAFQVTDPEFQATYPDGVTPAQVLDDLIDALDEDTD